MTLIDFIKKIRCKCKWVICCRSSCVIENNKIYKNNFIKISYL